MVHKSHAILEIEDARHDRGDTVAHAGCRHRVAGILGNAMIRIACRTLGVLLSAVLLASLIAAQPFVPIPAALGASEPLVARPANRSANSGAAVQPRPAPRPAYAHLRASADADIMRAPRVPAPRPRPAPARIPGDGPAMRGTLVAQTARLDLYVGKNTFTEEQISDRAAKFERVLIAAEDYFGTRLKHRVSVGFYRTPPARGVRGMAYTDQGRAEIYYHPEEDIGNATTVVMHELGHHLEAQRYGENNQRKADTILHEGMATWIASIRWLDKCGASTWRERAQQLKARGIPLRLLTAEDSGANNAYEMWASFVDYLTRQYGWDAVDELYMSGRGRAPGSANYEEVLGKSLDELADDWRAWVDR